MRTFKSDTKNSQLDILEQEFKKSMNEEVRRENICGRRKKLSFAGGSRRTGGLSWNTSSANVCCKT